MSYEFSKFSFAEASEGLRLRGMAVPGQRSPPTAALSNLPVFWLWGPCHVLPHSLSSVVLLQGACGVGELPSGPCTFCARSLTLAITEYACTWLLQSEGEDTLDLENFKVQLMLPSLEDERAWASLSARAPWRMGWGGGGVLPPGPAVLAGCPRQAVDGAHQPRAINTVTFPTHCIYVSENVCVAYVM